MLIKSKNSISEKYTIQIKLLYVRNAKALSLYLILFYVTLICLLKDCICHASLLHERK